MQFKDYITESKKTAVYPDVGKRTSMELAYIGLGIGGESGEVVDAIKKAIRIDDPNALCNPEFMNKIKDELGDLFWYIARVMEFYSFTPEEIFQGNLNKLHARAVKGDLHIRKYGICFKEDLHAYVGGPVLSIDELLAREGGIGGVIVRLSQLPDVPPEILYSWDVTTGTWKAE